MVRQGSSSETGVKLDSGGESDPSTGVAGGTRCLAVRAFDEPLVTSKRGKFLN